MKALARGATLDTPGALAYILPGPEGEVTSEQFPTRSTSTLSIQTERLNYSCWTEQSITPPSLVIGIEL